MPLRVSRYNSKYTIKTVKHPESVMVLGDFSGENGRGDLCFLINNATIREDMYGFLINICRHFGTFIDPTTSCRMVLLPTGRRLLKSGEKDNHMPVLEWPGNSTDLNPIANAWNHIKIGFRKHILQTSNHEAVGPYGCRIFSEVGRIHSE